MSLARRILALAPLFAILLALGCSPATRRPPAEAAPDRPVASGVAGDGEATRLLVESPEGAKAPDESIPLDPAVRHGVLDNGLEYYVRENHKPENRAELRLVVDAGSVVEDEDQRGLAHFVEHMAFNGTARFAKQELIDYLESIGMRFGPDINAYTSFDETVYMLEVPTDDAEIVGTAFRILEDWAHQVSFEGEEIDKERGVVIEEWRLGRGAQGRIRDKQLPVLFHGSRYAERLVIGDKAILESAPYDTLRRFYRDWYRPDTMAVVAVGDFDAGPIETLIREHFGTFEAPADPRPRETFPVPDHEETLASVVTDPEATSIAVSVAHKRPPERVRTVGDLRRSLVDDLYHTMMIARLGELAQRPDPPFQFAFAASGGLGRTKSMYRLYAVVRDGGVARGLETLLTEAVRVEQHGFVASELARAKAELLRQVDRQYEERDKQESSRFASEYVREFLEEEPAPSIEYTRDVFHELVPGITLAEVNARADQWLTDRNRVILVSGPDTEQAAIPDEQALLAVFERTEQARVEPWVDAVRDEPLVARPPEPGKIVERSRVEELDVTRWKLSNGVTVLLKPTDFKNDEVVLSGESWGGHSLAADEAFVSASLAPAVVAQMGAGNFSDIELDKALAGKVASARASIDELSEGISASASPADLETMFQLVHLRFTGARRDEETFASYVTRTRGWLENQEASPEYWFGRAFSRAASQNHPRREPLTKERLAQLDLDAALAFYRERFADASDFLFTIVGNFELESIEPLVARWLGGLPATNRDETWRDVGVEPPPGVVEVEVRRGIEAKSRVQIMLHGPAEWSPERDHLLRSLGEVMRIRLREVLREDLGGVYGVSVYGDVRRYPRERYVVQVSFSCDPQRVDELVGTVFAEIDELKAEGPKPETVEKVRAGQLRERETSLERNGFWVSTLQYHATNELPLTEILRYPELVATVDVEAIHDAARRYLDTTRYVKGVLYPEAK